MSLTRTRTRVRNAANESIVDMLEETLLQTESTNYKHTLRKALRAIRVFKDPILTKEIALKVPGVGQHIATQIQIHLLEQRTQTAQPSQPTMPEPGAVLLPDEPDPTPTPAPRRRPRARTTTRRKEYIPQYRTAAYGIMIALYQAESSGINAMRKDALARSAQQYCERVVLTQGSDDPLTWYDGWSCVNKTLVPKGLVARGGNPIKFSLSATGRELAERLVQMNNEVIEMSSREYRPDGPIDLGISNLPVARGSRATGGRAAGGRDGPGPSIAQNFAGPSQSDADNSQDRSQILSQEESDLEMARALARQFAEEDAVGSSGQPAAQRGGDKATKRPVSQPLVDAETASALERKYRAGREFGAVAPGVPISTPPRRSKTASKARRRKLTPAQCDRATRAIQRLEAGGYERADCIRIVEILHSEKALPRTVDGLYQAIHNALWEAEKQERRLGSSSKPIGLRISALDSDDDDDIMGYDDTLQGIQTPPREKPNESSEVSLDSVLQASPVGKVARTPESRPLSKNNSRAPVVVIDLDEDSVLDVGSPKASKVRARCPTTSNPPKRPRVADVIAIDSDDDVAVVAKDMNVTPPPLQPAEKSAAAPQNRSPRASSPPREDDRVGKVRSSQYPAYSHRQENAASAPSPAADGRLEAGSSHIIENLQPAEGAECRVVLLLDSMERFRNSNTLAGHVKGPRDLLYEEGVDCEVRTLPAGDALFIAQFPDGSEVVLDYIIERKTVEDYEASMKDGRVARQSYMMRRANIKRRVFLLEGDLKEKEEIYNKTELHKKLAEMTMCSGVYVKHTRDILDTVHFYASLYRRLQEKFLKQSKVMTLKERSLFSEWNDCMNTMKKSITLEQLFMIQLCQIPGVGTTKAQAIIDMGYSTPFLLYMAYKRLDGQDERDEMLNKGEHAIGSDSSKAVAQLFTQRQYPTKVKPSPHK